MSSSVNEAHLSKAPSPIVVTVPGMRRVMTFFALTPHLDHELASIMVAPAGTSKFATLTQSLLAASPGFAATNAVCAAFDSAFAVLSVPTADGVDLGVK